jgi:hypothetical protein
VDIQKDDGREARKARSPRVRKESGTSATRGKHTFVLSDAAYERLSVHAIRTKVDRSDILEALIHGQLRRYIIQDRGGAGPASLADAAKAAVETLPDDETLTPEETPTEGVPAGEGERFEAEPPAITRARLRAQNAGTAHVNASSAPSASPKSESATTRGRSG